jgi:hypothetical protein
MRAAQAGEGGAELQLAKCYLAGAGVSRSVELAVRHLAASRAAFDVIPDEFDEAGSLLAQFRPKAV